MASKKNTEHIRIKKTDKILWKDYCSRLGTTSPDLFSKVLKSDTIKLNQKIMEEMKKREQEMKKKLGIK